MLAVAESPHFDMEFGRRRLKIKSEPMATPSESLGGYHDQAPEFVNEEELEKYSCDICYNVLLDPHLTACCGQHICESCLMKWTRRSQVQSCPRCRTKEPEFQHIKDKKLIREINSLKVKCPNEGCKCELELGSLEKHNEGCGYVIVSCPNICDNDKLKRKDLEQHLKDECSQRSYECEHCGYQDTYEAITRPFGHKYICKEAPRGCPNNCGHENIKRKDMAVHRNTCPLEPVDCPFKDSGCQLPRQQRLLRCELDDHMEKNTHIHQAFSKTKRRSNAVLAHIDAMLKHDNPQQRSLLESMRAILDDSYHLQDEGDKLHLVATRKETYSKISISLGLLKGEFDDEVEWPLNNHNLGFKATVDDIQLHPSYDPSSTSLRDTVIPLGCHECGQSRLDPVTTCFISNNNCFYRTDDNMSNKEAQRVIENETLAITVTVCQHTHDKRRKLEHN